MRLIASLSFGLLLVMMTFLTSCQSSESTAATNNDSAENATASSNSGLHIVYINADSLQSGYVSLREDLSRLEENYNTAEANHEQRVRSLQREVQSLQNQIQRGELSQNRIGQEQQRIAAREQEIMQQQQLALNSIQEDQLRLQAQFANEVEDILEDLKAENNYDFVFNIGAGTGLLMANEGYDITELVLERLNAAAPATAEDAPETATEE
ncbi:MAG: OmpH family outer membrane protein [Bacteroidota bacterium]